MRPRSHVSLNGWKLALIVCFGLASSAQAAAPAVAVSQSDQPGIQAEPIRPDVWKNASKKAITSAEIDEMIGKELKNAGITPAPLAGDEQFLRRVYLDLAGKPPTVQEIKDFVADKDSRKRSKVIDKLLDGDAFARNWARYWQDVMSARLVANFQSRALQRPFERWLTEQIKKNVSWADVTRDML